MEDMWISHVFRVLLIWTLKGLWITYSPAAKAGSQQDAYWSDGHPYGWISGPGKGLCSGRCAEKLQTSDFSGFPLFHFTDIQPNPSFKAQCESIFSSSWQQTLWVTSCSPVFRLLITFSFSSFYFAPTFNVLSLVVLTGPCKPLKSFLSRVWGENKSISAPLKIFLITLASCHVSLLRSFELNASLSMHLPLTYCMYFRRIFLSWLDRLANSLDITVLGFFPCFSKYLLYQ